MSSVPFSSYSCNSWTFSYKSICCYCTTWT
jgi:hypothetical protein